MATKQPVFFIATRVKEEPITVRFYTKKGKPVALESVQKVKTKEGVQFFAKPERAKR